MPRRPRTRPVVDEALAQRVAKTLRECSGARGHYALDYVRLVLDVKQRWPEYPRPTVGQTHEVIEHLAEQGTIQLRGSRQGGPVIVIEQNGVREHEQTPEE